MILEEFKDEELNNFVGDQTNRGNLRINSSRTLIPKT